MRRLFRHLPYLLLALAMLASCDSNNEPTAYYLRAVHSMKDAPVMQVSISGVPVFSAIAYRQVTGLIPPISRISDTEIPTIELLGAVPGSSPVSIASQEQDFRANTEYTLVAAGTVAEPVLVIASNERRRKPVSSTYLQVTHASVDLGALDVFLTDPGADLVGASPFATLALGEFTDSLEILQQDYQIRVTRAGTLDLVLDSGTQSLTESTEWHLALIDNIAAGGSGLRALLSSTRGLVELVGGDRAASVRPLHMAPTTGPVDVFVGADDTLVGSGVTYLQNLPYIPVVATTAPVAVTAPADPGSILLDAAAALEAGTDYSYWLFERAGVLEGGTLVDQRRSVVTEGRIRFLQGLESDDLFSVYMSTSLPAGQPPLSELVVRDADYATVSPVINRKPGIYFLTVTSRPRSATNSETILIGPQELQLNGGDVFSIVVAPSSPSDPTPVLTFLDDQQF
jgi:hypothetical protein